MFLTERIWSFTGEGLSPREGAITLDAGEYITNRDDLQRPVHVGGLRPGDFAVFLATSSEESASTGCLVSYVNKNTGEGIIIGGDAVEQQPRLWLEKPFIERLMLAEDEAWADFGLDSLCTYLQSIK